VVVKIDEAGKARPWTVSGGRWTFVGSRAYLGALDEAIRLTEHESAGLGFQARYPDAEPGNGQPVRPLADAPPEPARNRISLPAILLTLVLVLGAVALVRNVGNDPIGAVPLHLPVLSSRTPGPSAPAAGSGHTCGFADRQIWCAGDNEHGQLGTGDQLRRDIAVPIIAAPGWGGLNTGRAHTCGIRNPEGTLWCWGDNADGELGLGDRTDRYVPTEVPGGERWRFIATGRAHTCAIRIDHTLWCWGDNTHGQLGLGADPADHTRPRQVGKSVRWASVFAEDDSACGYQDGVLWCWGIGYQTGSGPPVGSRTPVRVS
jgi:alpha-tubulin suppressor-like RCC1 family protein